MTEILRNRLVLLVVACAAVVGVVAGCGDSGSSSGVPKDSVAVVDGHPITKAQFANVLALYNRGAVQAKQQPVKCCSSAYKSVVQTRLMPYLVQRTEFEQQAKKLGVTVTPKEIDTQIKNFVDQNYHGNMSQFLATIKKQHATMAEVRDQLSINLLQQKVTKKLTAGVKVTDKEALDYYNKNKSSYVKQTSRDLAHILVKTKAKAEKIYGQLLKGASFAALAKQSSIDTTSGVNGGKLGVQSKQALVKPFSDVAFKLKTGAISKPVHTQFGWHIIKALGPVIPASTSPFSKEKAAIIQNLKQSKGANLLASWQSKVQKYYAKRVKYAGGYAPPQATAPAATSVIPTTPSG